MTEIHRREVPRLVGDELTTALSFLDFQRAAILRKCEDLDETRLRRVGVPSGTNLLGLVNHLVDSEVYWFHHHVAGGPWDRDFDDMDVSASTAAQEVQEAYRNAWARSNAIIRGVADPDALTALPVHERRLPLRWVLGHMTAETARHAGHADILREQIDGATGR
ncbi:MAG: DinB family protein [Lapillicoccus sp.]